jgi:uncharacterized protein GlcG (DUF336 family)
VVAPGREDGPWTKRSVTASGRAHGALAPGTGSRALMVPGGVLVQDSAGTLLGAVGLSGETSGHGELAAVADIEAAGSQAQPD